ncbi:MAG: hypothetical protein P4M02_02755, partial [Clostridia bacterium]|nr:hypothetical protein [Clostridia bacterium]
MQQDMTFPNAEAASGFGFTRRFEHVAGGGFKDWRMKMTRLMLRAALVGIFCWLAFAPAASANERQIPSFPADAHSDVAWSSARLWLQSADCARATKAILVICSNGQLIPLANVNPGDDPGHALVLDLYSAATGNAAQPSDILSVNTW